MSKDSKGLIDDAAKGIKFESDNISEVCCLEVSRVEAWFSSYQINIDVIKHIIIGID